MTMAPTAARPTRTGNLCVQPRGPMARGRPLASVARLVPTVVVVQCLVLFVALAPTTRALARRRPQPA
jgi:hypothetical protein